VETTGKINWNKRQESFLQQQRFWKLHQASWCSPTRAANFSHPSPLCPCCE